MSKSDVERLNDELFRRIERAQGYFFVSDGENMPTKTAFFDRMRGRLREGRKAVRILERFLRKYGEL